MTTNTILRLLLTSLMFSACDNSTETNSETPPDKHIVNVDCLIQGQTIKLNLPNGTLAPDTTGAHLKNILNDVLIRDQSLRVLHDSMSIKYGHLKEVQNLNIVVQKKIRLDDSLNLIIVTKILDKYGWLSSEAVGYEGNATLFLVIQHADLKTQEKYLPMIKEAVANYKASPSELALLIDRIEMRNNRPQIYGSQMETVDGKIRVYKIIDPKNVNKRRAEMGLDSIEDYVRHWNIEYKP